MYPVLVEDDQLFPDLGQYTSSGELPDGPELALPLRRRPRPTLLPLRRQGAPDGADHQGIGGAATSQADGALRRVDVHVHLAGTELEAQKGRRVPSFRQQVRVGLRDSRGEGVRVHDPAVNRDVQVAPRREANRERADEAPDRSTHFVERHEAPGQREPVYLGHPFPEIGRRRERQKAPAVRPQEEAGLGTAQSQSLDDGCDRVGLGPLGTEEAPAHGEVHEQVAHFDRRAYRAGGERAFRESAGEHPDASGGVRARLAGREAQGGDRGDRMQRLPRKPKETTRARSSAELILLVA